MSLDDWLNKLETLSTQEIVLGLDRVRTMFERLALPQPDCVIHVAGTNGKGSSVAMLEALFRQVESRVGCYTSPHVIAYNERIRVAGKQAGDAQIVAAFEQIEALRGDIPLTYFEYGTLAAMVAFAADDVATAILEVGLGGRLDAVNAIEADAGLICNISLDHCDWLGGDVEAIGFEKAGIMRAGKPVVFASPTVPASVLAHAEAISADLILCGRDYHYESSETTWSWHGRSHELLNLDLPALQGEFQLANAAGVLALVEALGRHDLLQAERINRAFSQLQVIGRMQSVEAGAHWLLDVAHNPASAAALADTLRSSANDAKVIALTGMLDDKDTEGVIAPLAAVVDRWIAVTARSPRALPAAELGGKIANLSGRACLLADSVPAAIEYARELAGPDDRVLVTGSFYVVGPVLEALRLYSRR